jgi:hypothetical protein
MAVASMVMGYLAMRAMTSEVLADHVLGLHMSPASWSSTQGWLRRFSWMGLLRLPGGLPFMGWHRLHRTDLPSTAYGKGVKAR